MDIFNINGIFKQIDCLLLLPPEVIEKLTKYIFKLYYIFSTVQNVNTAEDFYKSIDVFLYELELQENVKQFIEDHHDPLITYNFHPNSEIQIKIALLFEYIIYDILDMLYSYSIIFHENNISIDVLTKVMNNDPDFSKLNQRNKILFLDNNHLIANSYFKKLIKSIIPDKRMKGEFLNLLQTYFEYIIREKVYYNYINNCNKSIDTIFEYVLYKQDNINIECNSQIYSLNL